LNVLDAIEEFHNIFLTTQYGERDMVASIAERETYYALKELYLTKGTNTDLSQLLKTFDVEYRNGDFHNVADGIDQIVKKLAPCFYAPIQQFLQ
jgi:hypothetical protein